MTEVVITETMVLPDGMAHDNVNLSAFAVYVRWQSVKGWTVTTRFRDHRLSYKGRQWTHYVEKRNRRFYYFPTYDEALAAAVSVVNDLVVNGRTWAQWEATRND